MRDFTIGRLVLRELEGFTLDQEIGEHRKFLLRVCGGLRKKVTVIQAPGGTSKIVLDMREYSCGINSTEVDFQKASGIAEKVAFKQILTPAVRAKLRRACHYLTLGVDLSASRAKGTSAEFVGVYDAQRQRFIRWTGKSYPTAGQAQTLLYCRDLQSHFIRLNGHMVLVLGCHDLNMFSPRSWALAKGQSHKAKTIREMLYLVKKYRPTVVLQHPHQTDSPRIWATGWWGVRKLLPSCAYSTAVNYVGRGSQAPRRKLSEVLKDTARGNVVDWIQPIKDKRNGVICDVEMLPEFEDAEDERLLGGRGTRA